MTPAIALKATLQCICDHLPETEYEEYLHQQASEFTRESRILCQPVAPSGSIGVQAVVELLLSDGTLTLTGFGDSAYAALKDALNVFAPGKSPLSLMPNAR